MIAYEVGDRENYEKRYVQPLWAGDVSGITIGIGYDLAYVSQEEFRKDWGNRLPPDDVERLAAAVGKRGESAREALAGLSGIRVPWEAAEAVFAERTLSKYGAMVVANFPNAGELPPDAFGAMVSLVYNRGVSFVGDKRNEMRAIRDLMATRDFDKIPEQFRSMKRLWPASRVGLHKRRDAEAALFQTGLLKAASSKPL